MKKNLLFNIGFLIVISTFFACELMPKSDSGISLGSFNLTENPCQLVEVTGVINAQDGSSGNAVGNYAKDFTYTCEDGTTGNLSDFRGQKVVLIKFWNIKCSECMASLSAFNDLNTHFSNDKLLVLGMNVRMDIFENTKEDIIKIAKKYGFSHAYNGTSYLPDGYTDIPINMLIDKDGKIQFISSNLPTNSEIQNLLDEI